VGGARKRQRRDDSGSDSEDEEDENEEDDDEDEEDEEDEDDIVPDEDAGRRRVQSRQFVLPSVAARAPAPAPAPPQRKPQQPAARALPAGLTGAQRLRAQMAAARRGRR
jgi:hypothetical protein